MPAGLMAAQTLPTTARRVTAMRSGAAPAGAEPSHGVCQLHQPLEAPKNSGEAPASSPCC